MLVQYTHTHLRQYCSAAKLGAEERKAITAFKTRTACCKHQIERNKKNGVESDYNYCPGC